MKFESTKVLYNASIEKYDGARAPLCLLTSNFRHFQAAPGSVFFILRQENTQFQGKILSDATKPVRRSKQLCVAQHAHRVSQKNSAGIQLGFSGWSGDNDSIWAGSLNEMVNRHNT
jgi:hypothetical protein